MLIITVAFAALSHLTSCISIQQFCTISQLNEPESPVPETMYHDADSESRGI